VTKARASKSAAGITSRRSNERASERERKQGRATSRRAASHYETMRDRMFFLDIEHRPPCRVSRIERGRIIIIELSERREGARGGLKLTTRCWRSAILSGVRARALSRFRPGGVRFLRRGVIFSAFDKARGSSCTDARDAKYVLAAIALSSRLPSCEQWRQQLEEER